MINFITLWERNGIINVRLANKEKKRHLGCSEFLCVQLQYCRLRATLLRLCSSSMRRLTIERENFPQHFQDQCKYAFLFPLQWMGQKFIEESVDDIVLNGRIS